MKVAESSRVKTYYKKLDSMTAEKHDQVRSKINTQNYQERQRFAGIVVARSGDE